MYYTGGNLEAYAKPVVKSDTEGKNVYIIGSGLAGLAAACFLIRDAGFDGNRIRILEKNPIAGGACDGYEFENIGFVARGMRHMDRHYECLWDLLRSIPSLKYAGASVLDEIVRLSKRDPNYAICRLTEKCGQDTHTDGSFDLSDSEFSALARFLMASDQNLGGKKISEVLPGDFFLTDFWLYIQTTFGFDTGHGAAALKRCLYRQLHRLDKIPHYRDSLCGRYNEYESIILPLIYYLEQNDVRFEYDIQVTNVAFDTALNRKTATRIDYRREGTEGCYDLTPDDFVFITPGGMTENSTMGSQTEPAPYHPDLIPGGGWDLWRKIAEQDPSFGRPDVFCSNSEQSNKMSATLTTLDQRIIPYIKKICKRDTFSGKVVSGGLITCRDSAWGLSWAVNRQPYFREQPEGSVVIWITALHSERQGDFVMRPMRDCSGQEICEEWLYHIGAPTDDIEKMAAESANTVPAMMPYYSSPLMPESSGDRPLVVPDGAVNFAFIGQFADTPSDAAGTMEYAVRTAMESVYILLDVDRGVPEVWNGFFDLRTLTEAVMVLRDGKPLTTLELGYKDRRLKAKLLKKIHGTALEKMMKEYKAL